SVYCVHFPLPVLLELHYRSNLDRAIGGPRNLCRGFDRLVEILTVQQIKPTELLFRLSKWTIRRQRLPITHPHSRRCIGRHERFPALHLHTQFLKFVIQGTISCKFRSQLLLAPLRVCHLILINQQQVTHLLCPSFFSLNTKSLFQERSFRPSNITTNGILT